MSRLRQCPECHKTFGLFRWRHQCLDCSATKCAACLRIAPPLPGVNPAPYRPGTRCHACFEERIAPMLRSYERALSDEASVETWPTTYAGRVPVDPAEEQLKVASTWHREKDDALEQIRITALFLGFDIVYKVRFERDTDSEPGTGKGVHKFSIWQAHGVAARRQRGGRR